MTLKGMFLWRGGVKCGGGNAWKTGGGEHFLWKSVLLLGTGEQWQRRDENVEKKRKALFFVFLSVFKNEDITASVYMDVNDQNVLHNIFWTLEKIDTWEFSL